MLWAAKRFRRVRLSALAVFIILALFGEEYIRGRLRRKRVRAGRSRLEQDPAALLRRQPADPLMPKLPEGASSVPAGLENLRVSVVTGPLLLTAPHGIPLWRQDFLKGAEPSTTKIAWRYIKVLVVKIRRI